MHIRSVATNIRDWNGGTMRHGNSIFVFEVGSLCVAHLGHLHHTLTQQQLNEIGRVDVVMVPVDGSCTLDLDGMVEVLQSLKAPLMIPMHYFSSGTLNRFLDRVREQVRRRERRHALDCGVARDVADQAEISGASRALIRYHRQNMLGMHMPYAATRDGTASITKKPAAARRSCSCMNSAATTGAGKCRCAISRGAIAASPIRRAATRPPTCRRRPTPTATSTWRTISSTCSIISRSSKAHLCGLSMGGYTTLQIGLNHPDRALSLTLAGTGSGAELDRQERISHRQSGDGKAVRDARLEGSRAKPMASDRAACRLQSRTRAATRNSQRSSASTMRRARPTPCAAFRARDRRSTNSRNGIRKLALPTLIVVGDEDDACIEPSLFLKRCISASGSRCFRRSGHCVNLEEPALFNQTLGDFLSLVEAGRWPPRDPRSVRA